MDLREVKIGKKFFAIPRYGITFKRGSYQVLGVVRRNEILILKFQKIGEKVFKPILSLVDDTSEMAEYLDSLVDENLENNDFFADYHIAKSEEEVVKKYFYDYNDTIKQIKNHFDIKLNSKIDIHIKDMNKNNLFQKYDLK